MVWRFAAAASRALVRLGRSEDLTYASSIAYYALVSLFPFLFFAASVLGRFTADDAERAAVIEFVLRFFPEQVDLVSAQLEAIGEASLGLGVAGSAVIVWVSLGVFRSISAAVNHAWGAEARPSFLRNQLVAFVMLMATGGLLLLALVWVSAAGVLRATWFAQVLEAVPVLEAVTGMWFSSRYPATAVLVVMMALVLYFVPHTTVRFRDVWLGALVTGVLWHAALAGFSWYLRELADLSIHGSIATVVTFLFWVFIEAVIFIYGVEFTAAWVRAESETRPLPAGAAAP